MWNHGTIVQAAADWTWIPYDAQLMETAGYRVVITTDVVTVLNAPDCDVSDQVDGAIALAASTPAKYLEWAVHPLSPARLGTELNERGASITEKLDICARVLAPAEQVTAAVNSVTIRRVDTPSLLEQARRVDSAVFGFREPTAAARQTEIRELNEQVALGECRQYFRYVALIDGEAVGSAGMTMDDGLVKLWGGGVVESARRRGVYSALLGARIDEARRRGATLALVKGRVNTSAPILRRAGFTAYGTEQLYRLLLPEKSDTEIDDGPIFG